MLNECSKTFYNCGLSTVQIYRYFPKTHSIMYFQHIPPEYGLKMFNFYHQDLIYNKHQV